MREDDVRVSERPACFQDNKASFANMLEFVYELALQGWYVFPVTESNSPLNNG